MAFSKKIRLEAKRRSAFRCCICKKIFVEIHHIIPQSEGGEDTLANAAPLCSSCHDLFGGNPEKRNQITEMRNEWWEFVSRWEMNLIKSKKLLDENLLLKDDSEDIRLLKSPTHNLIYHRVYPDEDFAVSAKVLFDMVQEVQRISPNLKRILLLEIDGHRNEIGGFDFHMMQLQHDFILGYLMNFLSEVVTPLIWVKNPRKQRNDLPELFIIQYDAIDFEMIPSEASSIVIYSGSNRKWYNLDKHPGY